MDALIVDFDGVMVDSEPTHLKCFQQVLAPLGIELSTEQYYARYLGKDDRDCFAAMLADNGRPADADLIAQLIARKTLSIQQAFATSIKAQDGALSLLEAAEIDSIAIAICSGGLRSEIEIAARKIGAMDHVMTIVSAEDVSRGKPDPEGYQLALTRLIRLSGRILLAPRTLVVEDAPAGIDAAHAAGMKVLAVATSYEPHALTAADMVVASLADVTLADVQRRLFGADAR